MTSLRSKSNHSSEIRITEFYTLLCPIVDVTGILLFSCHDGVSGKKKCYRISVLYQVYYSLIKYCFSEGIKIIF